MQLQNLFLQITRLPQVFALKSIMSLSKIFDPKKKQDHSGNCLKTCILCLEKSDGKFLNDDHKELFAKHVYPLFFEYQAYLPKGLCSNCRIKLTSQEKSVKRPITRLPDYDALIIHVKIITEGTRTRNMKTYNPFSCYWFLYNLANHIE